MPSCSERKMIVWILCLIFSLSHPILIFASFPAKHMCHADQRDALWEFKSEFHPSGLAASEKTQRWRNNTDCCSWDGITCDPNTGNVAGLNLLGSSLNGSLRSNSSLFRLQHLQSLDLSSSNLAGILPDSIGNLKNLRVLKLLECNLFGKLPSSLGNLSYLTHLDLDGNDFTGELPDLMGNLNQLTKLILASSKLSGNFPHVLLNLTELTTINLHFNQLEGTLPSNMSSLSKLEYFNIGSNSFSGSIPSSLFMIPSLIHLNLERNGFSGPLEIGNISSPSKLQTLSLGGNSLNGPIPGFISKLAGLLYLDLSFWNIRRGVVGFSIFLHLKSLTFLDLSHLNTRSMVDMSLFSHLMSLSVLHLSGNNLNISSTLNLPSPIGSLALASCNISEFPKFLQTQTSLFYLDISNNQIKGQVPEWLWSLPGLGYVDFSRNSFSGFDGPADVIQRNEIYMLDISSNTFKNPFPLLPKSIIYFSASDNQFSGEIPKIICELDSLGKLILSNNNFSGSIPRCFENFNTKLTVLHLQNNSLSGEFPEESISVGLVSLDVSHNQLSGELPKSLINCTYLQFVNVEDNMFNDMFPFGLRVLPGLQFLVLRSNKFHGPLYPPEGSMSFPKLRIFDISKNLFSGALPSDYFAGWNEMSSGVYTADNRQQRFIGVSFSNYSKSVVLTNKGSKMELLGIYKTIDVSENRFEGEIPKSISLLKELIVLNMSNNAFVGHIPPSLSSMTNLQSLDLSRNRLSGKIPPKLGKLTFLAWMNFSYNMLEGPIPQGTQIQSQNSSSFVHNLGLCGAPLQKTCSGEEEEETRKEDEENYQVLSGIVAAIAYVPGVFCGLVISHILISYRQDWFKKISKCIA
ncbi:receptor-like protein 48 isoform X1 [Brassica napus]|uniref:receptor-like protein 48 isoform X1 n=1 Tax=Brassica napus TaxID=3708 RepID=UPI000BBE8AFB|nr:receptor-like protein 48 isoform X1 [Brassica napus]